MRWWRGSERRNGRRAAILVSSLFGADATGNDALAMRDVLRDAGWDTRIYAEGFDAALGVRPASEAPSVLRDPGSLVVYHQSTWWDHGVQMLRGARGIRLVRDHNVTPASYFADVHEDFVRAAEAGERQRAMLARERGLRFVAASATNAAELVALGADASRIAVVPPFHRAEELAAAAPSEIALRRWARGNATALFVGRLAPNKGQRRLLRVAAVYGELFGEPLRLRLVGGFDARLARWRAVLDRDALRLGLGDGLEIVGPVDEAELKAAYLSAHLLLCTSEHEGFCVPLVEAARLGVPVVATPQTAVVETLGSGGLIVDGSDEILATAVHRVLRDAALREDLRTTSRAEYAARFSPELIRRSFLAAIAAAVG